MTTATTPSAAVVAVGATPLTCPVCDEDFSNPKILPCTHLVCRDCVRALLDKGGNLAVCPLCHASILPLESQGRDDLDLDLFVDDLATDVVTMAKVEVQGVLDGEGVCACDRNAKTTKFCVQCFLKLCASCCKVHTRLPATQDHRLEDWTTLTPDALLGLRDRGSPCPTHPHLPSDLFCPTHQHLICIACRSATHETCPEVVGAAEAATRLRAQLKERGDRLKEKTGKLDEQTQTQAQHILSMGASFQNLRHQITTVFDDLLQLLQKRRHDLLQELALHHDKQRLESSAVQNDLAKRRGVVSAHEGLVRRLLSVEDRPLLVMGGKLRPRLDQVEACEVPDVEGADAMTFDGKYLEGLKERIGKFGALTWTRSSAMPEDSDTGPATPEPRGPKIHAARSSLVRHSSSPCSLCADDITALDGGDLYTCHCCTRMWLACETCGCVVTLRHRDGFRSQMTECPKCGDC